MRLRIENGSPPESRWEQVAILRKIDERHAVRAITAEPMDARCPECDSIVYSRRHKLCGICGNELPEEFLFTPAESERLENVLRSEQLRHREWMRRSHIAKSVD